VKIALNKLESTSVTKILVDDQWKDTQTDIEEALFPINKGKINASQHTPFLQPHLRRALGDQGYEAAVDEILEGSFAIPGGKRQIHSDVTVPSQTNPCASSHTELHNHGGKYTSMEKGKGKNVSGHIWSTLWDVQGSGDAEAPFSPGRIDSKPCILHRLHIPTVAIWY